MKGLGFSVVNFCQHHHDVYHREPVSSIEMHRGLMSIWTNPAMGDYYYDVREKMILDDGKKYTYHFGAEDFYLYMTAHTFKHYYSGGGTGLRSLVDEYVYVRKFSGILDWDYISREAGKMNLAEFERDFRNLALYVFGGDKSGNISRQMLKYIISSGTYGHIDTEMEHITAGAFGGSKVRYLLAKIFIPFSRLKYINPYVYSHKYLYPVYVMRRIFRAATVSRKNVIARLRSIFSRRK